MLLNLKKPLTKCDSLIKITSSRKPFPVNIKSIHNQALATLAFLGESYMILNIYL